jgi:ABC-type nitrate/sulfonate/bicarbonate transport system permease component
LKIFKGCFAILAAFAPLYIAAVSGVQRVPRDRINKAQRQGRDI